MSTLPFTTNETETWEREEWPKHVDEHQSCSGFDMLHFISIIVSIISHVRYKLVVNAT